MNNKTWLLVILLGFIWGSSFLFTEILLNYINPVLIVFFRVSLASIILIIYVLFFTNLKFNFSKEILLIFFTMGLLNNVIPFLLIAFAQETITGGLASILNANTSFFTIFLASLFLKDEKLTNYRLLGIIIGIIGVVVIVGFENLSEFKNYNFGIVLMLFSCLSYSFAGIFAKTKLTNIHPTISATGMLSMSTIILFPFIIIYNGNELININSTVLYYSCMFALICSVLAYFLYFKILETNGAGNLLICTIIIPPSSILLNAFFINEIIKIYELIGLIIITLGLIILDGRIINYIKNRFI
jgi:drug/metabolite transporter (DMT)-like permease